MRRRLRYGLSAMAGVAIAAGAVATSATAHPAHDSTIDSALQTLAGNVPGWATASNAIGTLNGDKPLDLQIALPLRNESQLESLVAQSSSPGSPLYHKFLTADQFNDQYAPTQQTVDKVSGWLKSQGFKVTGASEGNRHFVNATGSVNSAQKAFHTTLKKYSVNGTTGFAPSSAVELPSKLVDSVTAVLGLDNGSEVYSNRVAPTVTGDSQVVPNNLTPATGVEPNDQQSGCADYWGQYDDNPNRPPAGRNNSAIPCVTTPKNLQQEYGIPTVNTQGQGVRIGLSGAYDLGSAKADSNKYFGNYGLPQWASNQFVQHHQAPGPALSCGGPSDWAGEQMLDIESTHIMAPKARVIWSGAKDCAHNYDALNWLVSGDRADVISNSWGADMEQASDATRAQANNILLQAAAQGQSVLVASGDHGDSAAGKSASNARPQFPASSPWVTAVGGTTLARSQSGGRLFETGWESRFLNYKSSNDSYVPESDLPNGFYGGAGGGLSRYYKSPQWQQGKVSASYSKGYRAVPDVAALADPETGIPVGYTQGGSYSEVQQGGTSLASPLMAGIIADTMQLRGNHQFGLLNPALYKAEGTSTLLDIKHVPSAMYFQSNSGGVVADNDAKVSTLQSAPGWDNVTGVGVPNGREFLRNFGK